MLKIYSVVYIMPKTDDTLVLRKLSNGSYGYNRTWCNEIEQLSRILISAYKCNDCLVTSSGMSAISTILHSVIHDHRDRDIHIIYANELYCDTPNLITYLEKMYGNVKASAVDIVKNDEIVELLRINSDKVNILFFESCSNPTGYVFDFDFLKELKKMLSDKGKLFSIVDNTWLTHTIFNPFDYDVDYVVLSLTKYYSAGTAICGAIMNNTHKINLDSAYKWARINGLHVSPINCKTVIDNIKDIKERMMTSYELTVKILEYFNKNEQIVKVNYPLNIEHVSYNLACKYFKKKMGPSIISFWVKGTKTEIVKILKKLVHIDCKTSYGYETSRICSFPKKITDDITACRIAIGYKDTYEKIMAGVDEFLNKLNGTSQSKTSAA